jgi:hypothetical protein
MCIRLPANERHLPVALFCRALAMPRGLRPARPQMHAGLPDFLSGLHQALSVGYQALRCRLPQAVSTVSGSARKRRGVWEEARARVS